MKNSVLEDIKKYAIARLNAAYDYCGLAESETNVMLTSDDKKGHDFEIIIREIVA